MAFDDAARVVGGSGGVGRPPLREVGLLVYIMVDRVVAALEEVVANGGEIVQPIGADTPEITERFRDPSGNVLGLHQEPAKSGDSGMWSEREQAR